MFRLVAEKIELLQGSYDRADLLEIMPMDFFDKLVSHLIPDHLLLLTFQEEKRSPGSTQLLNILEILSQENTGPRFFATKLIMRKYFESRTDGTSMVEKIDKLSDNIEDEAERMAKEQNKIDDYSVPNWIGIS